jgi:hypothetical protein
MMMMMMTTTTTTTMIIIIIIIIIGITLTVQFDLISLLKYLTVVRKAVPRWLCKNEDV